MDDDLSTTVQASLEGQRIALVGPLAAMSRREMKRLLRERGATPREQIDESVGLAVVGGDHLDRAALATHLEIFDETVRRAVAEGRLEVITESELLERLGVLAPAAADVCQLYTEAMLSQLLEVPPAAVRRWHRRRYLRASHAFRRLAYFDFSELAIARHLACLFRAGCSLPAIDRKLTELAALMPHIGRPLADPDIVIEGRQIRLRRSGDLAEPSGQLLLEFDTEDCEHATADDGGMRWKLSLATATCDTSSPAADAPATTTQAAIEELRETALELEAAGQRHQAIELYRMALISSTPTADDQFSLAELLYRGGDLAAARERYYAAIEADPTFVEARSNLGCLLEEMGDWELAEAAFAGALALHEAYAEAHYHLARLLDRQERRAEATRHWQRFAQLVPESPWAEEAEQRLAEV